MAISQEIVKIPILYCRFLKVTKSTQPGTTELRLYTNGESHLCVPLHQLVIVQLPLTYVASVSTFFVKPLVSFPNRSTDTSATVMQLIFCYGPLARYVKLWVAHAPGMPGMFSPLPTSKETASKRSRHASRHVRHARAMMHVGIANPRRRGNRSRHSRRMRNLQFYVSGKRPMAVSF